LCERIVRAAECVTGEILARSARENIKTSTKSRMNHGLTKTAQNVWFKGIAVVAESRPNEWI
jgi:hypothetical protein